MQGTVATFDTTVAEGTVYLDDGTVVAFDAAAFSRSGLLTLRLGQRVDLVTDEDGKVWTLHIPTMPG